MAASSSVDVLIVTAILLEYEQLLRVTTGALEGGGWVEQRGPTGLPVSFGSFRGAAGNELRVAATWATEMGGVAAANAALPLVAAYQPQCIAMCGVCAGRPGKVGLGDVIVADRLYFYDTGKLVREKDASGNDVERVYGDLMTFNLAPEWKQRAERLAVDRSAEWLQERPLPYEQQENWLLEQIERGADPTRLPERKHRCPDYSRVIRRLWARGLVNDGTMSLSAEGSEYVNRSRILYPDGPLEPKPFEVHVGPIATGARVIEDPHIFDRLASPMRKVLGLEMEAAAIGAISQAWTSHAMRMIVMKGVMDFADHSKDDNFKLFAARASAECLLTFLRENMPAPAALERPQAQSAPRQLGAQGGPAAYRAHGEQGAPPAHRAVGEAGSAVVVASAERAEQHVQPALNPPLRRQLRTVLSTLISTSSSARMVASDVGLPIRAIAFDGPLETIWFGVLDEAEKQGRLMQLLEVVRDMYPANSALAEVSRQVLAMTEPPVYSLAVSQVPKPTLPRIDTIHGTLDQSLQLRQDDVFEELRAFVGKIEARHPDVRIRAEVTAAKTVFHISARVDAGPIHAGRLTFPDTPIGQLGRAKYQRMVETGYGVELFSGEFEWEPAIPTLMEYAGQREASRLQLEPRLPDIAMPVRLECTEGEVVVEALPFAHLRIVRHGTKEGELSLRSEHFAVEFNVVGKWHASSTGSIRVDLTAVRARDALVAARFVLALSRHQRTVKVISAEDGAVLFEFRGPKINNAEGFANSIAFLEHLSLINDALALDLRYPHRLDPQDVNHAAILASNLAGKAAESPELGRTEFSLPKASALHLLEKWRARASVELSMVVDEPWRLLDAEIDVGRIVIALEGSYSITPLEELEAQIAAAANEDQVALKIGCKKFVYSFSKWVHDAEPGAAPERSKFDLFCSARHVGDVERVALLVRELRARGVNTFFDAEHVDFGAPVLDTLLEGIARSRGGIVVVDSSAVSSGWANEEYSYFLEERRRRPEFLIVPAFFDEVPPPASLRHLQGIDLRRISSTGQPLPPVVAEALDRLAETLRSAAPQVKGSSSSEEWELLVNFGKKLKQGA